MIMDICRGIRIGPKCTFVTRRGYLAGPGAQTQGVRVVSYVIHVLGDDAGLENGAAIDIHAGYCAWGMAVGLERGGSDV